jgi:O-antigen ligase
MRLEAGEQPALPMRQRFLVKVTEAAVFLIPALSLCLPSGYSVGALLLVLAGAAVLADRRQAILAAVPKHLRLYAVTLVIMGFVWASDMLWREPFTVRDMDRPIKYALVLLAMPAIVVGLRSANPLKWGVWFGAWGAAVTAAWQLYVWNWDRAWGYTNAIPFGQVSLLLGIWSWAWARQAHSAAHRLFGWSAALAGIYACLASASRGVWMVMPLLVFLVLWLQPNHQQPRAERHDKTAWHRTTWKIWAMSVVLSITLFTSLWPSMQTRLAEARSDWSTYQSGENEATSLGQRLAHWKLAWNMGWQKPWLGWGQKAYEVEKKQLVESGHAPKALLEYGHAHQEWLDIWAKKGLLGVCALALFFAVPLECYASAIRQSSQPSTNTRQADAHTMAVCGLVMVVGYLGFGMTQVVFAHNSSSMVYLFMNLIWLAALLPSQHQHTTAQHVPR